VCAEEYPTNHREHHPSWIHITDARKVSNNFIGDRPNKQGTSIVEHFMWVVLINL